MSKLIREVVSISVPGSLRKRMKGLKEPVNWSQVATQAFEERLASMKQVKEAISMEEVVQRLRVSRRNDGNPDFKKGLEAGRVWAQQAAKWQELERLAKKYSSAAWEKTGDGSRQSEASTHFSLLLYDATDLRDLHHNLMRDFWDVWAIGVPESGVVFDFIHGFWKGAVDVYEEVRDQVEAD